MGKTFVFASVARPTWRYRLFEKDCDNPGYDWRSSRTGIDSHLSQYDTMGDREVQHSPDIPVAGDETYDVVISLGAALHRIKFDLNDETNCEACVLRWFWRRESAAEKAEIEFALSLKYSETKRQWYTFTDNGPRKSTSESKKHDRRWIEVPSTSESVSPIGRVLTILGHDETKCRPHGIINQIATIRAIAKIVDEQSWQYGAVKELKANSSIFERCDRTQMFELLTVFERITTFKKSITDLRWARHAAENQAERVLQKQAEKAEAQPAEAG